MKITLVMAMTLDGKIAMHEKEFANWTSEEDKKHFKKITTKAGAIVMGMNTFRLFKKPLKDRKMIVIKRGKTYYKNGVWFYGGNILSFKTWADDKGFKKIVLCGGGATNYKFAKNWSIDEMYITIEPKIFCGGISLFQDDDYPFIRRLKLLSIKKLNTDSILLHYKVLN